MAKQCRGPVYRAFVCILVFTVSSGYAAMHSMRPPAVPVYVQGGILQGVCTGREGDGALYDACPAHLTVLVQF